MEATKARTPRPATTGNGFTHLVLHLKIATRIARDVEAILKTSGAVSEQCSSRRKRSAPIHHPVA